MNQKRWTQVKTVYSNSNKNPEVANSLLWLSIRIITLFLIYLGLEKITQFLRLLPQDSYTHPIIFIELVKQVFNILLQTPIYLPVLLAVVIIGGLFTHRSLWLRERYRLLGQNWTAFEHFPLLRIWITLVAGSLAWWFSTYDYNLFFHQGYLLDRLVLITLVGLIYWRPLFIFPFLMVLIPVISQFFYPLGGYSWTIQDLLLRILILFSATFLIAVVTGYRKLSDFIFMACCLIAAHYLPSGVLKIKLNWLIYDHVYYFLPNSYANGWLGFLGPSIIDRLTQLLVGFNFPIKIFTLILECGGIFCLWNGRVFRFFLIGWMVLHIGIFAISGFCFWPWIFLEMSLFIIFFWHKPAFIRPIFTRRYLVLSWIVILAITLVVRPVGLAWYDTPLTYTYRFAVIGNSGQSYSLSSRFFAPYDYMFRLNLIHYLSPDPILVIGVKRRSDLSVLQDLQKVQSLTDIETLEAKRGRTYYDRKRCDRFDAFIQQFVGNWNQRQSKRTIFSLVPAPPIFWIFPRKKAFTGQEPISTVDVFEITSRYGAGHYQEVRQRKIREIAIL